MARGGAIPGNGRKPKADEERIRDLTSPYVKGAIEAVVKIMQTAEKDADRLAAAKLILAYNWGSPRQQTDITTNGETLQQIMVQTKCDATELNKI